MNGKLESNQVAMKFFKVQHLSKEEHSTVYSTELAIKKNMAMLKTRNSKIYKDFHHPN
jgi:hypothetical protein